MLVNTHASEISLTFLRARPVSRNGVNFRYDALNNRDNVSRRNDRAYM